MILSWNTVKTKYKNRCRIKVQKKFNCFRTTNRYLKIKLQKDIQFYSFPGRRRGRGQKPKGFVWGKSGLLRTTIADNVRRRQLQGKCNRKKQQFLQRWKGEVRAHRDFGDEICQCKPYREQYRSKEKIIQRRPSYSFKVAWYKRQRLQKIDDRGPVKGSTEPGLQVGREKNKTEKSIFIHKYSAKR